MGDSSATFSLNGAIQRADDGQITKAAMGVFMDDFIELVERHGFLFGGGCKLDPEDNETLAREEIKDAVLQLHNTLWMLENEYEQDVPWKSDAEALISKMEACP